MNRSKPEIQVGEKQTKRNQNEDIYCEDFVDHLVYVRLLKSILALVQDQLSVFSCVKHEQIEML